ncbi:Protein STRUBBELIG-RECEPTOR FAMILY 1 [Hordeum vulgare]|nr:Protein STRUBBELIG-RECEPTOR FAMILY 1 [Hordeum vulgare]
MKRMSDDVSGRGGHPEAREPLQSCPPLRSLHSPWRHLPRFDFVENGTLSDWLHDGGATLAWKQHVKAAFDIVDGHVREKACGIGARGSSRKDSH